MSKEEWAAHVKTWRAGDVSARVYCEAHGLPLSKLRYWASQLRDGVKPRRVRLARVKKTAPVSTVSTPTPTSSSTALRLISLEIPPDFDGDALERVLAALRATR